MIATAAAVLLLAAQAAAAPGPAENPQPSAPPAQSAPPAPAAPAPAGPAHNVDLDKQFEKAEKLLDKAGGAAIGNDPGRVSTLLRRADEEIARFQDASGLERLIAEIERSRALARADDLAGAETSLRAARRYLAPLAPYTVGRSAEVAFRSAQSAAEEKNASDFLAAVDRLEAATLAPALLDRLQKTRAAIGRARSFMVRSDLPNGRREVDAARSAFHGVTYIASLSRARYGLLVGSELLEVGALLAARDQTQKALRELRQARDLAPERSQEALQTAQEEATAVWRRINKPAAGDAQALAAAGERIEAVRQATQPLPPGAAVSK